MKLYISHEKIADMNWYRLKIKHALSKTTGITWPSHKPPLHTEFINEVTRQFTVWQFRERVYDVLYMFHAKVISNFVNKDYKWDKDDIQGMEVSPFMYIWRYQQERIKMI